MASSRLQWQRSTVLKRLAATLIAFFCKMADAQETAVTFSPSLVSYAFSVRPFPNYNDTVRAVQAQLGPYEHMYICIYTYIYAYMYIDTYTHQSFICMCLCVRLFVYVLACLSIDTLSALKLLFQLPARGLERRRRRKANTWPLGHILSKNKATEKPTGCAVLSLLKLQYLCPVSFEATV